MVSVLVPGLVRTNLSVPYTVLRLTLTVAGSFFNCFTSEAMPRVGPVQPGRSKARDKNKGADFIRRKRSEVRGQRSAKPEKSGQFRSGLASDL